MNLNDFAKKITLEEGKLESLSIAQVKEVIKLVLKNLSELKLDEVDKVLNKYR